MRRKVKSTISFARRAFLVALGLSCAFAANPLGRLEQEVEFHISAGSLETALIQWSTQTQIQVVIAPSAPKLSVAAIEGRRNAHEVLLELLSDTGLTFRVVAETISVLPKEPQKASSPPALSK
jgi:hypothetical protein